MFRWLGRQITSYAPVIIIAILLISMGFALAIPNIEFKTNLTRFLPDNELVRANDRVNEYFGDDFAVHLIYIEEENTASDVLSADALKEQFDIYQRCKNRANIEDVVSIVSIFDSVLYSLDPTNYTGINDLDDSEIETWKTLFFEILQNSTFIFNLIYQDLSLSNLISPSEFLQLLNELPQLLDIFLDKSFNYYSSEPKARSTIILVLMNGSLDDGVLKSTSEDLRDTITTDDYSQITVRHTGSYLIAADLDSASEQSFSLLGIVIIILIVLILLLSFRRFTYVGIPLLTLGLAIVWTFGTMMLLGIEFTVITVAIIPLIVGLGVDYSVYISKRYQEELHNGKDISEAIEIAVGSVGTAMFLAVITTIIAFMSNLSSNIAPLREFGIVCGLGIFYAFFLTLTFHTSARWLIDIKSSRNPTIGKEKELYVVELGTKTASKSVVYYPILVLVLVFIITLGAFTFGMNVRTEFNNKDFLPNDWESLQTHIELEDSFNGSSFSQAYILLENSDSNSGSNNLVTVDTLEGIRNIEEKIGNDKYVVRINGEPRVESVLTLMQNAIKTNATLKNLVDADNDDFPDDDTAVQVIFDYLYQAQNSAEDSTNRLNFYLRASVDKVLYRDSNGEYSAAIIRVYVKTEDSDEVRKMYDELKDDMTNVHFSGIEKSVTGDVILTVTTMDSLQDSQIISTIISILFALVILILIYRNFTLGVIAITPVLLSSVWILGTMYIFGISINVFTVSITALTIGLGIDYAIHIIERFREEYKKFEAELAVQRTIRSTGTALFISALTTVCGFIVLTISPIPPIQHFGIITAMTIIYSSILAMVVIPILLMKWAKSIDEKKAMH